MYKILFVMSFVTIAVAMPPCLPDACKTVRCALVTKANCNGVVKYRGDACGCCDVCLKLHVLKAGEQCYSSPECIDGLFCDAHTTTCKVISGPCAMEVASVQSRLQADVNNYLLGLETPKCDIDGYYEGMQTAGSQAVCVTKNGTRIDNYMVYRWMNNGMNCHCARDEYAYEQTGLVGKQFHCDPNGNYASIGCTGSVCYCQDTYGKQIGTSTVQIGARDSLNC